ncbi:MAG TPA: hypothetical protein VKA18_13785, partial [Alphaproteobacteria bacterium]|nr:hypothetical protein [Alphaproteobacteria bacterium]
MLTNHAFPNRSCLLALALIFCAGVAHGQPASSSTAPDPIAAIENLKKLRSPELGAARISALETRLAEGRMNDNDNNLICIGALSAPFAVSFGVGLVPNPPWDYLLGQVPAYAANLGLKFCPPFLEQPADIEVFPNVDTADGAACAYDFSQPVDRAGPDRRNREPQAAPVARPERRAHQRAGNPPGRGPDERQRQQSDL